MAKAFKQGQNYTNVWYGEFVVIDTTNKNHKDNGKIYRRGLDYQNSLGGAEYIGQIVGPSSGTPYFQIDDIEHIQQAAQIEANGEDIWKKYPVGRDSNGKYIVKDYTGNGKDLAIFDFDTKNVLVPGKTQQGTYNDSIRYTWVNIREDNADADSWFYVGFQIPYTVIDYGIHSTNPYDELGNRRDLATIERQDTYEHPFWELWEIGIPKGIKGDALKNLKIITPTAADRIYTIDQISATVDKDSGNFHTTLGTPGYPGQQEDITNNYKILVYEYVYYDNLSTGETVLIYLGDYKMIDRVRLDNEGTLYLDMTHDGTTQFTKKIRWIDLISLTNGIGSAGGHFTFTYNNDTPRRTDEFDVSWIRCIEIDDDGSLIYTFAGSENVIQQPADSVKISDGVYRVEDFLTWIKSVTLDPNTGIFTVTNNRDEVIYRAELDWIDSIILDDDGTIHFHHVHNNYDETHSNVIKWVKEVELTPTTGLFTMKFNYGPDLVRQLDWIDDIYINEANGEIAIHHVDDSQNTSAANTTRGKAEVLNAKLKLITSVSVSEDGIMTFHTNTNENIVLVSDDDGNTFHLKYLTNVQLLEGINDDKHIQIKYNTEADWVKIGSPTNWVQDMVVRTTDWHLLVLYTDPTHRPTAADLNDENEDAAGHKWVSNITGSDGVTNYGSSVYWRDMGTIKDQSGVLIGYNFTHEDIQIRASLPGKDWIQTPLDYLNDKFPDGLVDGNANTEYSRSMNGKVATYSTEGSNDVDFYAFNYGTTDSNNGYEWYYLGSLSDSGKRDIRLISDQIKGTEYKEVIESITTNGVLVTYWSPELVASTASIPAYWSPEYKGWI